MRKSAFIPSLSIFLVIWLGQVISLMGSELTSFALGVWVYQKTQSVTQFAFISVAIILPTVILSPIAGIFADRFNRRWIMILGDSGAALSTLMIVVIVSFGQLQIWHIYLANIVTSCFSTFQQPAYTAATTQLVPQQHLARASGLSHLGYAIAQFISPMLGGVLLVTIGLQGVILIDLISFFIAIIPLMIIVFPDVPLISNEDKHHQKTSLSQAIKAAWSYLTSQNGLFALLLLFTITNLLLGLIQVLFTPLILSFTSAKVLGLLLSFGGVGMVIGSLIISIWGSSKYLINSLFLGMIVIGICLILVGFPPCIPLYAFSIFCCFCCMPIVQCSNQVIFQKKVPLQLQGRVFAFKNALANISLPIAYIVAGPLADKVFEPLMKPNGLLSSNIGQLIGLGSGRGIALMFIIIGVLILLITALAFQYSPLRLVEKE